MSLNKFLFITEEVNYVQTWKNHTELNFIK